MRRGAPLILGIGELLWDLLPDGPRLGGAPLNVVANARRLGWRASIVTAVGADDMGADARAAVRALGVEDVWIQEDPDRPTGSAGVVLDAAGNPTFELMRPAAYDSLDLDERTIAEIATSAPVALVFGTLAQQSASVRSTTAAIAAAWPSALRLYDVNLRAGSWDIETVNAAMALASIVKVNEVEADVLAAHLGLPSEPLVAFMTALLRRTAARGICVTRGSAGAELLIDDVHVRGGAPAIVVVDSIGAGDAFVAALVHGIVAGRTPPAALRRAVALGSLVAGRAGGVPAWSAEELAETEAITPVPTSRPVSSRRAR